MTTVTCPECSWPVATIEVRDGTVTRRCGRCEAVSPICALQVTKKAFKLRLKHDQEWKRLVFGEREK